MKRAERKWGWECKCLTCDQKPHVKHLHSHPTEIRFKKTIDQSKLQSPWSQSDGWGGVYAGMDFCI